MAHNTTHAKEYRTKTNLTGSWKFVTDPNTTGIANDWHQPDVTWPERATEVQVPGAWQELDDYRDYTGTAWYRRTVSLDDKEIDERRAVLRFTAVDYETTVYVNGIELGTHRGGYLPFEFDATDALKSGSNTITIQVNDPDDISEIPHGKQGDPWYSRVSGIWGDVSLEFRPPVRVEGAEVTPNLNEDTVRVELDVHTASVDTEDMRVQISVGEEGKQLAYESLNLGSTETAVLSLDDPTYWTPETPHLYDIDVELVVNETTIDRFTDYFGMRSFETDGDRFLLNGEPIRIRGALDQAYYPETLYRPFSDDLFEREIKQAKELGFNLLRKHIKPAHPSFVEAADRLGILVWEEPANPSVDSNRSRQELREQFEGLVKRDYNAPSVVIWSLYNEEWGLGGHDDEESLWTDEEKQSYLAEFYEAACDRDPSRLICDNSGWAHVATDVNDYHRYFVSPDRADAWANDLDHMLAHPADNYGKTVTNPDETPIVLSEFGTWGFPDLEALRTQYDGDPPWFNHDFFDDPIKRPAGVDERYETSTLPDVYEGYNDLATAWQAREYTSIKDVIEQTRTRDGIAGYVITEFSDIEWEFNGLLNYDRTPKSFTDSFASVNNAVMVRLEPDHRSMWADASVSVTVTVVNDTTEPLDTTLSWSAGDQSGSVPVHIDGFDSVVISDAFTVKPPAVDGVVQYDIDATIETDETQRTTEPIWFVNRSPSVDSATVFVRGTLASGLAAAGVDVKHELTNDVDIAIASAFDDEIRAFAESGGNVVMVPAPDGTMDEEGPFEFSPLPPTESWNLVASFHFTESPLFESLVRHGRLGWAFDELYPYAVASDVDPDADEVHAGYIEGWLANSGSTLVSRDVGDGTVTACSFRVSGEYGSHPVGTILIDRLLKSLDTQ